VHRTPIQSDRREHAAVDQLHIRQRDECELGDGPQPLTADEARAAAAAEGLELEPSSSNATGFKGVVKRGSKYVTNIRENGTTRHLGRSVTPEEAALCYARHVRTVVRAAALTADDGQGGVVPLPPKAVAALPSKAVTPSSALAAETAPTTAAPAPAPASEAVDDEDDDQVMLPSVWQEAPDVETEAALARAPASEAVDDEDDDQVMLPSAWQDSTASDGACGVDCA